ncbi:MAG: iron-sulfur cluster assembly scaffold protein [Rhodospirillales bacterium]|nr:iron-sulfur cluster assembly scaffold protein [Rhodospirillales bacterium]
MSSNLYQDKIIALSKDLSNAGRLDKPDTTATLDNPLCGDRVTLDIKLKNNGISELSHHVRGCALCKASAALLATEGKAKTSEELMEMTVALENYFKEGKKLPEGWQTYEVFAPVKDHKSRYDCVLLPLKAAVEALS